MSFEEALLATETTILRAELEEDGILKFSAPAYDPETAPLLPYIPEKPEPTARQITRPKLVSPPARPPAFVAPTKPLIKLVRTTANPELAGRLARGKNARPTTCMEISAAPARTSTPTLRLHKIDAALPATRGKALSRRGRPLMKEKPKKPFRTESREKTLPRTDPTSAEGRPGNRIPPSRTSPPPAVIKIPRRPRVSPPVTQKTVTHKKTHQLPTSTVVCKESAPIQRIDVVGRIKTPSLTPIAPPPAPVGLPPPRPKTPAPEAWPPNSSTPLAGPPPLSIIGTTQPPGPSSATAAASTPCQPTSPPPVLQWLTYQLSDGTLIHYSKKKARWCGIINGKRFCLNLHPKTGTVRNIRIIDPCTISKTLPTPTAMVDLLTQREQKLKILRYKIGILSSEILESPEEKSNNFLLLLNFMEEKISEIYVSVRKLAAASLLEIFKDLLPSYSIRLFEKNGIILKKETLRVKKYEASIIKYYKQYLQKLEKMAGALKKKRHSLYLKQQDFHLGIFSVICLTDLLIAKPYINFSSNVVNFLVPFLDNRSQNIRKLVANCFIQVFKQDTRGELSLTVLRRLNKYIKIQKHLIHVELISILLCLQVKHTNLDKDKEDGNRCKQLLSKKKIILMQSKKEKKRRRKVEQIEKEMLETKAEESQRSNEKITSQITNLLFTIYFRILKEIPSNKILSSCLEGLSKFSKCVSTNFHHDLVNVIHKLLDRNSLTLKEKLHCIYATFQILLNDESTLNIDSVRLYAHLYKNLLEVHIGRTNIEIAILISSLLEALVSKYKIISRNRLLAFVKRISTVTLNLQQNGVLAIIGVVRLIMQYCKAISILLDTDCSTGNGIYLSESEEPEYSNAYCTSLWEMVALQRHYHTTVQNLAKNILMNVPDEGNVCLPTEILKLSPEDLYKEYDPSEGIFNPAIFIPKVAGINNLKNDNFTNKFNKYVTSIQMNSSFENNYFNLFQELNESNNVTS